MKKTAFLDRDGVLNKELGRYTRFADELEVLVHAKNACKNLKALGYQLIVITNQGGIAKGEYSEEDLAKTHLKLRNEIPEIDAIYYCPHHDNFGKCLCRKPNSLLVEKAIYLHDVDRKSSFFLGDSERDVLAAEKVGVKGIKIDPNENWEDKIPS
jgi:D-glycero-D-manno-heptose 1,7-bisphosphate phosphatase